MAAWTWIQWTFLGVQGLLILTKIPDLWTTYRHVGIHGESNPIGRWLFKKLGLGPGLFAAGLIQVAVVVLMTWICLAWNSRAGLLFMSGLGLFVAWTQLEVARYNTWRRHSWSTRIAEAARLA